MEIFDAVVIGGGILGCFTARNLTKWNMTVALLESAQDVCSGITRANAAVIYAGYDHAPGTAKATFTLAANAGMDALCRDLEVPFLRRGSLMAAFGPNGESILRTKLAQGQAKGVPGLQMLTREEALAREPLLDPRVTAALYAPTTGTLNPWQLGIAAYENAVHNGCVPILNTAVQSIRKSGELYQIQTDQQEITCRSILNCAGLQADRVQEMLFPPRVRLQWDASDFLILDRHAPTPEHILFQELESGKGITAVPTVDGNLMLISPARPLDGPAFATTRAGLDLLTEQARDLLPGFSPDQIIRSFASVRPNPRAADGKSIPSFVIADPAPNFLSLIGVKTPGLTCADQLGDHLARRIAAYLGASRNTAFDPHRKAIPKFWDLDSEKQQALLQADPRYGHVVCQCGKITEGEIREAILRGAVTVDGIKRRVGTGMGVCQGSRCRTEIEKILHPTPCHEVRYDRQI